MFMCGAAARAAHIGRRPAARARIASHAAGGASIGGARGVQYVRTYVGGGGIARPYYILLGAARGALSRPRTPHRSHA
jgi:hypothetical protein